MECVDIFSFNSELVGFSTFSIIIYIDKLQLHLFYVWVIPYWLLDYCSFVDWITEKPETSRGLTHFMPQVSFYTLLNIRKPEVFWSFLRVQKETSDIRCVKSCSIFPGILWDHTVATFNSKTVNFSKNYTRLKENETRGLNR